MHFFTTAAAAVFATAALTLIAPASAQQVYAIEGFGATDNYAFVNQIGETWDGSPPEIERHIVVFNVSRPRAVQQQGGDVVYSCRIEWQGCEPKTCYTPCIDTGVGQSNSQYWTRVTPGAGRKKAVDISVDLLQYYSYHNSVVQNGTFFLKNQETGSYGCVRDYYRGYLSDRCEFKEEPKTVDVDVELLGDGIYPVSDVVEICS